jgi:large subunit ribosomal protein L30
MAQLKITLTKSTIGHVEKQRATVKALGLKKISSFVVREDTAVVRGMLDKVNHLVKVEEIK